jgi:hypothetical protein
VTLAEVLEAALVRRSRAVEAIAAATAEVASIDNELAHARQLLGVTSIENVTVAPAPASPAATEVPDALKKTCEVCGGAYVQTSPRQRMCATCREQQPHASVERLTGTAPPDGICALASCGKPFALLTGTKQRYCSRECYTAAIGVPERDAAILAALRDAPNGLRVSEIAEATDILRETIRGRLDALRVRGAVAMEGIRAGARWKVVAKVPGRSQDVTGTTPGTYPLTGRAAAAQGEGHHRQPGRRAGPAGHQGRGRRARRGHQETAEGRPGDARAARRRAATGTGTEDG